MISEQASSNLPCNGSSGRIRLRMQQWNETRKSQCSKQRHVSFDGCKEKIQDLALSCLRMQVGTICEF